MALYIPSLAMAHPKSAFYNDICSHLMARYSPNVGHFPLHNQRYPQNTTFFRRWNITWCIDDVITEDVRGALRIFEQKPRKKEKWISLRRGRITLKYEQKKESIECDRADKNNRNGLSHTWCWRGPPLLLVGVPIRPRPFPGGPRPTQIITRCELWKALVWSHACAYPPPRPH